MNQERNDKWIWDIVFTVIGCAAGVFLLWKCRYGFANMDEVFYLLTPYRLCQGDALFAGEWHLSQMSAFLVYPWAFWAPVAIASAITIILYVLGQNLADASDPRTHM